MSRDGGGWVYDGEYLLHPRFLITTTIKCPLSGLMGRRVSGNSTQHAVSGPRATPTPTLLNVAATAVAVVSRPQFVFLASESLPSSSIRVSKAP